MNQTPMPQCNAGSGSPMNSEIKASEVFTSKYGPPVEIKPKPRDLELKHASAPSRALVYKLAESKKSRHGHTTTAVEKVGIVGVGFNSPHPIRRSGKYIYPNPYFLCLETF
jgi:hypothetical protein